jgi:hypothetical protein
VILLREVILENIRGGNLFMVSRCNTLCNSSSIHVVISLARTLCVEYAVFRHVIVWHFHL